MSELQKYKKKTEKWLEEILDNVNELILILNYNLKIEYINAATFQRLLGLNEEEIIGKSLKILMMQKDFAKISNQLSKNYSINEKIEVKFKHKDGHYICTELKITIFNDDRDEKKILITAQDISEHTKIEKALKESEELYKTLVRTSPEAIIVTDLSGKIIEASERSLELNKFENLDTLLGRTAFEFLPPEDQKRAVINLQKTLKHEYVGNMEYQFLKKDGTYYTGELNAGLIRDINGKPKGFIGTIRDVTERKKAEHLIEEEVVKLKELGRIRSDLMSRVSHELKTPLMSIYGASELLVDYYSAQAQFNPEVLDLLKIIERGAKRLDSLVKNMLDLARVEFKALEIQKKPENLSEIIRDCIKDLAPLINSRGISLVEHIPELLTADVDKFRIDQVIINLLSNAIKNTPPKGIIEIFLQKISECAEITVKDTGIGLTNEELKKIFEQFVKFNREEPGLEYLDIQGTGIGLYISKQIVELHKGKIWAESDGRNKGSTFTVRIPLK